MAGIGTDYIEVNERIVLFRESYPDGCLRPVMFTQREEDGTLTEKPYRIERIDPEHTFIVYTAAAYRTPDDPTPGIGTAWEPFPGKTNFTRDSELMNAETSAWGRAIVATLAGDAKRGIASANEVRNRKAESEVFPESTDKATAAQVKAVHASAKGAGVTEAKLHDGIMRDFQAEHVTDLTRAQASSLIKLFDDMKAKS